jgi:hypothetical protein
MNSSSFFTRGFILTAVEAFNLTASAVLQRIRGEEISRPAKHCALHLLQPRLANNPG